MFRSEGRRRRGFGPLSIFRLMLSLVMFAILGLGAYQAFSYFSGNTTPEIDWEFIRTNPKAAVISMITSESSAKLLSDLLNFDVKQELSKDNQSLVSTLGQTVQRSQPPSSSGRVILKVVLVADSHNDNANLAKALQMAQEAGAKFIIGLGDYTATGTIPELTAAKKVFESSGLPYYLTSGDHDLWESREKGLSSDSNFTKIFGSPYQSFVDSNIRFVLVFNSDNYLGSDDWQMSWLEEVLSGDQSLNTFVFLHEPLTHPTADRVMGKTTPKLLSQAQELISLFDEAGVAEVFAGDIHAYSRYEDKKTGLKMTTVGAITQERNLQLPRFLMVDVFEDGSYNIEDLEIK